MQRAEIVLSEAFYRHAQDKKELHAPCVNVVCTCTFHKFINYGFVFVLIIAILPHDKALYLIRVRLMIRKHEDVTRFAPVGDRLYMVEYFAFIILNFHIISSPLRFIWLEQFLVILRTMRS